MHTVFAFANEENYFENVSVNYKGLILQCKVQKKFYDTVPKIPDHKVIGENNILQSRN